MQAQAVWFVAPRKVEVRPVEVPEPGDGELLVRTRYSGISAGTEMLAYRGEIDPEMVLDESITSLGGSFSYPFRYGYSCVGTVERSHGAVPEGTLVFAFQPHQDRFVVAERDAVPLGQTEARAATLFPLVETALQLALDAGSVLEERVVVFGLGAVGILTAAMLQRAGARVTGVEPQAWRREAAAAFGVQTVAPEEVDAVGAVHLVVEASGRPEALVSALGLLAHEGTALVASWYGSKPVSLPLGAEFHRRRLSIRSSQVTTIPAALSGRWTRERRRDAAVRLLGELPVERLATHEFTLAAAAEAFAAVDRGEPGLVHAALTYD